jgi:hypothetical protein
MIEGAAKSLPEKSAASGSVPVKTQVRGQAAVSGYVQITKFWSVRLRHVLNHENFSSAKIT